MLESIRQSGQTVLKAEWLTAIEGMAAAIAAHPKASSLLQGGKPAFLQPSNTQQKAA